MGFRGDERGQSVQIGAVLLFGFLVVSMATYQTTVVPHQNEGVELRHSQSVQADLQRLHDAVGRTAATGASQSTSVAVGTSYRPRALFVNPPPPSGTVRTIGGTGAGYALVGARATGEAGAFWSGDDHVIPSTALVYAPTYHEYRSPPETVVEGAMAYNRFGDDALALTDQSLVNGRMISLVALDGSLSRSRSGTVTVDTRPLSVSTNTMTVRSADDEGIRLYALTAAPGSAWREALADERAAGNVERIRYYPPEWLRSNGAFLADHVGASLPFDEGQGLIEVVLNPDRTYDLRMAKVGVGSGGESPAPAYLVETDHVRPTGTAPGRVTVEVRDRYNNPVGGTTVEAVAGASVLDSAVTTGADGRATFTYREPPSVDGTARFRVDDGDPSYERVDVTLRRIDGASAYALRWDVAALDARSGVACTDTSGDAGADRCTVGRSAGRDGIPITVGTDPATAQVFVDLSTSDAGVAKFGGSEGNTGEDGRLVRDLGLTDTGETTLRAASVEANDALTLRVVEGVYYRYYEGDYGATPMPDFANETPTATGYSRAFDLSPAERGNDFAIEYTAYLTVREEGTYAFYTESDDGSELYVDGERVVDNAGDHGANEESGKVDLSKGEHALRVAYYENDGDERLNVSWERAGFWDWGARKEPIPTRLLRPRYPDDPLTPNDDDDG